MLEITTNTLGVLMPNYNNGPYLHEALQSVFNQSYQDFLIYFIDDGSTDNSIEIAKTFDDDRLLIVEKEENTGIVDTLNIGLKLIETHYFVRMDGDDISVASRFEDLIAFMESNQEYDICGSNVRSFGVRNEIQKYETNHNIIKAKLIFGHGICHATAIFKTSILKENGIQYKTDYKRLEDYNLFYDLRDFAHTTNIPAVLYQYRQEEYNFNDEIKERMLSEYSKFYHLVLKDLLGVVTEDDVINHIGISLKSSPTRTFNAYKSHTKVLIEANRIKKSYPEFEFEEVISKNLNLIKFKLIDNGKFRLKDIVFNGGKIKGQLLRYYIGQLRAKIQK